MPGQHPSNLPADAIGVGARSQLYSDSFGGSGITLEFGPGYTGDREQLLMNRAARLISQYLSLRSLAFSPL